MTWYTADAENKPVRSILVNVLEMEESEAETKIAQDLIRVTAQI